MELTDDNVLEYCKYKTKQIMNIINRRSKRFRFNPERVMPFGKYRKTKIKDLVQTDLKYLNEILKFNENIKRNKRLCEDIVLIIEMTPILPEPETTYSIF